MPRPSGTWEFYSLFNNSVCRSALHAFGIKELLGYLLAHPRPFPHVKTDPSEVMWLPTPAH